jgi:hypothetical protein
LTRAKGVNKAGKILLLLIIVLFNVVFWTIAINEYLTPPENYVPKENSSEA